MKRKFSVATVKSATKQSNFSNIGEISNGVVSVTSITSVMQVIQLILARILESLASKCPVETAFHVFLSCFLLMPLTESFYLFLLASLE